MLGWVDFICNMCGYGVWKCRSDAWQIVTKFRSADCDHLPLKILKIVLMLKIPSGDVTGQVGTNFLNLERVGLVMIGGDVDMWCNCSSIWTFVSECFLPQPLCCLWHQQRFYNIEHLFTKEPLTTPKYGSILIGFELSYCCVPTLGIVSFL